MRERSAAADLTGVTLVAALLRFPTLGLQSFWHDEAVTAGRVLGGSLASTLAEIPKSESTPPLYYVLAWGWSQVFGTGEFGLRALSAIFGTATIAFVYLATRELASRRAALIAALLAAVDPFLVWYSQEARAYALVTMLAAASAWLFLRALRDDTRRPLIAWAVVAALALASHYFAVFVIVPEALGLLYAHARRRVVAVAVACVAVVGAALLPLALDQAAGGRNDWIARIPMKDRLRDVPEQLVAGEHGSPVRGAYLLVAVALIAAAALACARARRAGARPLALLTFVTVAALIVPLLAAGAGQDFFVTKNLLPGLVIVFILAGVGIASLSSRAGRLWAGALVVALATFTIATFADTKLQRADWRSVAQAVERDQPDAIVVPAIGDDPLAVYLPGGAHAVSRATEVRQLDAVGWPVVGGHATRPPMRGFRRTATRRVAGLVVVSYESTRPRAVSRGRALRARIGFEPSKLMATGTPLRHS